MFGLDMLDVLIGLVTVYLTFGIVCTAFVEAISTIAGLRGRNLRQGIHVFFKGSLNEAKGAQNSFVDAFYAHPLIQTLSKKDNGRPSYIPTEVVGQVVTSLLHQGDTTGSLKQVLESLPGDNPGDNRIKDLLQEFYRQAKGDIEAFRQSIETHFDASMERVAGWFKRKTQYIAICVASVLVFSANIDTIQIIQSLAANPEARVALVQSAEKLITEQKRVEANLVNTEISENPDLKAAEQKTGEAMAVYKQSVADLEMTGLNLGWEKVPPGPAEWLSKLAGLLASALAVSLGAPFWFQVLQRFMQVRGTGGTPKKKT